jgi:hypothetical protein
MLYKAVMFAMTNGVSSAQRGGFTISINLRLPSHMTDKGQYYTNLAHMFFHNNRPLVVIRETLENCTDYECAFNVLSTTHQIAPSYYCLSGNETYQGVIIARDRFSVAHVDFLSKERWYVAQTNDDHWTGKCTQRCKYVHDSMDDIGRHAFKSTDLFDIHSEYPSNNAKSIFFVYA